MNRGYFDPPDANVHLGGIAGGGMPIRSRCSRGASEQRGRERGRQGGAGCRRNQRRKCWHTSRLDKLCPPEPCGLSHRHRLRILIRRGAHCVRRAQLVASPMFSASKRCGRHRVELSRCARRRRVGCPSPGRGRGGPIDGRLLEYHGHDSIREPGRGLHGHAQPERLRRKAAHETTHAITMSRYAERRCSPSASTSRSLQP